MKLIVGGAYQGKLAFACSLAGRPEGRTALMDRGPDAGEFVADGKEDAWEAAFQRPVVYRLHEYIRRICDGEKWEREDREENERGALVFVRRLIRENPRAVVVCNELGCGIVPVEKADRVWREATGDACQLLAEHADEVYRVVCGIPVIIKEGAV